jgi:uncharacterized membrane protein (DUF2068 family)
MKKLKKIANILIMLATFWAAFGSGFILLSSSTFLPSDVQPILESASFNFFTHNSFLILPIAIIAFMLIKEFKVKSLRNRIYLNLLLFALTMFHCVILVYVFYKPVFDASKS